MPQALILNATRAVNYSGAILNLNNGLHTIVSPRQFQQYTDIDFNRPGSIHMLKGATVDYDPVKAGEDRGDGTKYEKDGIKVNSIDLSERKGELIYRLASQQPID